MLAAVEPRLWNMSTVLPILQDTTIVAAAPNVQNVSLTGAVPVGIVGDAGNWVKGPGRGQFLAGLRSRSRRMPCAVNAAAAKTTINHSGGRASSQTNSAAKAGAR